VEAAQTFAQGDLLDLNSSGQIELATASSGALIGVAAAASAAQADGTQVPVYADPDQLFEGQCSGTFAITLIGNAVDIEGTTGIMEINENAITKGVVQIIDYPRNGPDGNPQTVGANSRVFFKIAKHRLSPLVNIANTEEAVVLGKRLRLNAGANVETLGGNKTLTVLDAKYQKLDPDGSNRDVNLPAEASSIGLEFWIANAANGAKNLVVKNDGADTILTLNQDEAAVFICDGTDWVGMNVLSAALT